MYYLYHFVHIHAVSVTLLTKTMAMFRSSPRDVVYRPPIKRNCDTNPETYFCNICFDGWDSETEVEIHRSVAHRREIMKLMKNSRATYCCRVSCKLYYFFYISNCFTQIVSNLLCI